MKYDFHIHSCLSPCAEDDMTPANIAGFAKLAKIDAIAIADHNSALNLPAAKIACDAYGVKFIPAIEMNTEEEIHLLLYFNTVENALKMGEIIYTKLPEIKYDTNIWGRQLCVNENDEIINEPKKLLTTAAEINIYDAKKICESLGGIAVPAHVDKDSYSLLSVLGFAPDDLPFCAYEVKRPEHNLEKLINTHRLPKGKEILTSSDAHSLEAISEHARILEGNSCLLKLF
jgi:PHP family Zn ribbon phosphoesterase